MSGELHGVRPAGSDTIASSEQAQLGELAAHLGGEPREPAAGFRAEVGRRVLWRQIAPALERAARDRAHGNKLRLEQHAAAWRPIVLGAVIEADEALAHLDSALDHPIERAAVEQLRLPPRRLKRRVEDARLAGGLVLRAAMSLLPGREILDRDRTDAKFDQVHCHCPSSSSISAMSAPWATCWPSAAATRAMRAARGACMTCSIFIASTTAMRSPFSIIAPSAANILMRWPLMGARMAPPRPAPPSASRSASGHETTVWCRSLRT